MSERDSNLTPAAILSAVIETLWNRYFVEVMMLVEQGGLGNQNDLLFGGSVQIGNIDHSVTDYLHEFVLLSLKKLITRGRYLSVRNQQRAKKIHAGIGYFC